MENGNEKLYDLDNKTFEELKRKFPNLSNITYRNGSLFFEQGIINLKGKPLATFNPMIFSMNPRNLYLYLSNEIYLHYQDVYRKETQIVIDKLNQLIVIDNDKELLERFTLKYLLLEYLYQNEEIFHNDNDFIDEFNTRKFAIDSAYITDSLPASIIKATCNNFKAKNNNQSNTPNSQNQNRGKSLSLGKPGTPKLIEDDNSYEYNSQGFASYILIIIAIILIGAFIAYKIIS